MSVLDPQLVVKAVYRLLAAVCCMSVDEQTHQNPTLFETFLHYDAVKEDQMISRVEHPAPSA